MPNNQPHTTAETHKLSISIDCITGPVLRITPDTLVKDLKGKISEDEPLAAAVVVRQSRPIGLVMSLHLDRILSRQFGVALFYEKPISKLMDTDFLTLDKDIPLEKVCVLAMKRDKAKIFDHVVVTEAGHLKGIVSVQNLLIAMTEFQHWEKGQLEETNVKLQKEMTDRKRAERERALLESKLMQAQKIQAIGTLAGGIAHDFNNVLYPIIGFTEMAMEDATKPNLLKGHLEEVLKGAHRARDMVKQILAFSRQDKQGRKSFDMVSLATEVMSFLRASIPSTIEISQDIDERPAICVGDSTQMHQVLVNLCTNAMHAMKDHGGHLTVSVREATVERNEIKAIPHIEKGQYVRIVVSDTGIGMTDEVAQRVFDPYFSTKAPGEGTGMGLSLVHGIVKNMHGHIYFQTAQGKGTVFYIYIPVGDDISVMDSKIKKESYPERSKNIFIIDDEKPIVDMVSQMLKRLGHKTMTETSSAEALNTFQKKPEYFDLVILDHTMPQLKGPLLAKRFLKIKPDLPIILATGNNAVFKDLNLDELGIRELIMKPITKDQLAHAVERALATRQKERTDGSYTNCR